MRKNESGVAIAKQAEVSFDVKSSVILFYLIWISHMSHTENYALVVDAVSEQLWLTKVHNQFIVGRCLIVAATLYKKIHNAVNYLK